MKASSNVVELHRMSGSPNDATSNDALLTVRFTNDGTYLAAVSSGGPIHFFGDKSFAVSPCGLAETSTTTTCMRFSPTAELGAVCLSSGSVQLWDVSNAKNQQATWKAEAREEGNETLVAEFSTDGKKVVSGGKDTKIRLYDVQEGGARLEPVSLFEQGLDCHGQPTLGHSNRIFALKFLTPHTFLSAGWETSMLLFDTRAGTVAQRSFEGPSVSGDGIDFIDNTVVAASYRTKNQLQVFDISSGREMTHADLSMMAMSVRGSARH